MADGFFLYQNMIETMAELPADKILPLLNAMVEFRNTNTLPEDPVLRMLILAWKPSLETGDGRKQNGGNHNPTGKNQYSKNTDLEVKVVNSGQSGQSRSIGQSGQFLSETRNTKNIPPSNNKLLLAPQGGAVRPKFSKPTLEDVRRYCQERKNSVDAERWFSHYESNGWKVGKNPMKDWKAAVRTWEKSEFNARAPDDIPTTPVSYEERAKQRGSTC